METKRKFAICLCVMVAVLSACNQGGVIEKGIAQDKYAGLVGKEWNDMIEMNKNRAKDQLFKDLQDELEEASKISVPIATENNIDLSRKDLIELKAFPVFNLDSASLYGLTAQSDFLSLVKLDMQRVYYVVGRNDSILLAIQTEDTKGWYHIASMTNLRGLDQQSLNGLKAFQSADAALRVVVRKRQSDMWGAHFNFLFKNGTWISCADGKEAVQSLMDWRDTPPGLVGE